MDKNSKKDTFIEKRNKKRTIKRKINILIILSSILITLCLKLSFFDIKYIEVFNNKNIKKNEIVKLSGVQAGNNIFYINTKNIKENLLSNPYIVGAKIKRKIPNKLEIFIEEREVTFYNKRRDKFIVIDKNGVVLEEKDDISNMDLIKLEGMDFERARIGEVIDCDDKRKIKFIGDLTELMSNANSDCPKISLVDINSMLDIKIYFGDICVLIGCSSEFQDKINSAINIIEQANIEGAKGYIDISFDGNPVVFVEN